jgi:hypothetical protein
MDRPDLDLDGLEGKGALDIGERLAGLDGRGKHRASPPMRLALQHVDAIDGGFGIDPGRVAHEARRHP